MLIGNCFVQEEVLAPPPENDDVVNDFDIEEEVIEVENRLDIVMGFLLCLWLQEDICETKCTCAPEGQMSPLSLERRIWQRLPAE